VTSMQSIATLLIRSPLLWGGALGFCFFALIHTGVITHAGTIRYLAGHWVEYVETVMFTVGLSALAIKWLDVRRQAAHVDDEVLEPIPEGGQAPAEAVRLQAAVPAEGVDDGYLSRRLRDALDLVVRTGSADGLEDHLKYLSDLDAARASQSYGLVRFVIWAIPIMGFLGTVIGITEAIANLSPTQLENISGVVAGLGVAFDTTATALALSMVLMLVQFFCDKSEQRLLADVDDVAWTGLAGRFQSLSDSDGTALALARLSEEVTRGSAGLIAAQERAWRMLEEAAAGSLARAVAASGQELRSALSDSLGVTLSQWTDSLARAHAHASSQREDRWSKAADALTAAMAGFERHQQALADQTELLERVVDATRDVTHLERSLEDNLAALTATGRFDETLATLSAAVQLLAARAADGASEPRRVELHALPRRRAA